MMLPSNTCKCMKSHSKKTNYFLKIFELIVDQIGNRWQNQYIYY